MNITLYNRKRCECCNQPVYDERYNILKSISLSFHGNKVFEDIENPFNLTNPKAHAKLLEDQKLYNLTFNEWLFIIQESNKY